MSGNWKCGLGLLAVVLVVALAFALSPARSALSEQKDAGGFPRYTVVATDGTHLIVTDNHANKVYFYAIEQGGKPGDEMKYRGEANLEDVGKPVIKPTKAK
jgi:hypothetical protein